LTEYAPTVDAEAVTAAGVTAFRDVVAKESLTGVLRAYSSAVDHTFYLAAGASVIMFVFAFGMGWQKIKTKMDADAMSGSEA
jgi:ABC-type Mn2+/Zn2+ transport system permease subunit